jgi:hypothetical protein
VLAPVHGSDSCFMKPSEEDTDEQETAGLKISPFNHRTSTRQALPGT